MPRNTRDWARRKLEQSITNIDWSGTHLAAVYDVYEPYHPDIAGAIKAVLQLLEETQSAIANIRKSI